MRKEIENPIISDRHPIKDPQEKERVIVSECESCRDPIYADEEYLEFDENDCYGNLHTLHFHDDDQCLALWLRENSQLVSKNDR